MCSNEFSTGIFQVGPEISELCVQCSYSEISCELNNQVPIHP